MNPQEKANELYNRYYQNILTYGEELSQEITISLLAKQFALSTVQEILDYIEYDDRVPYKYWEEVKQEIKKL